MAKGFTLLELCVVVVLMSILASYGIARFQESHRAALLAHNRALAGQLQNAVHIANGIWRLRGDRSWEGRNQVPLYELSSSEIHDTIVDDKMRGLRPVLDFNIYGYPAQYFYSTWTAGKKNNHGEFETGSAWDCSAIWNVLLDGGRTSRPANSDGDYRSVDHQEPDYIASAESQPDDPSSPHKLCRFRRTTHPELWITYNSITGKVEAIREWP